MTKEHEHEHVSRTRTTDTSTKTNAKCQSSNAKREREPEAGGLRVEAEGKMSKFKRRNLWKTAKSSSERENIQCCSAAVLQSNKE